MGRRLLVVALAVALAAAPSLAFAGEKAAETSREGGLGAAAAISSLVYAPLKLVYAAGGLVVGAFAWAFTAGDTVVAEKVFTRSVRGTYVITPDILTGEKEFAFIGRDVETPVARQGDAVASASGVVRTVESYPTATYESTYGTVQAGDEWASGGAAGTSDAYDAQATGDSTYTGYTDYTQPTPSTTDGAQSSRSDDYDDLGW